MKANPQKGVKLVIFPIFPGYHTSSTYSFPLGLGCCPFLQQVFAWWKMGQLKTPAPAPIFTKRTLIGFVGKNETGKSHDLHGNIWLVSGKDFPLSQPMLTTGKREQQINGLTFHGKIETGNHRFSHEDHGIFLFHFSLKPINWTKVWKEQIHHSYWKNSRTFDWAMASICLSLPEGNHQLILPLNHW